MPEASACTRTPARHCSRQKEGLHLLRLHRWLATGAASAGADLLPGGSMLAKVTESMRGRTCWRTHMRIQHTILLNSDESKQLPEQSGAAGMAEPPAQSLLLLLFLLLVCPQRWQCGGLVRQRCQSLCCCPAALHHLEVGSGMETCSATYPQMALECEAAASWSGSVPSAIHMQTTRGCP